MRWDYDVATPRERPIGGSQSALAYLAAELARRGSRVTLYCGTTWPHDVLGVSCVPTRSIRGEMLRQPYDAFVVLNGPAEACLELRPRLDPATALVLWTQHAADQDVMRPLQSPEIQRGWDAWVCVSDWQRTTMIARYGLDPSRVVVLRNAIGPSFEDLFSSRDELVRAKLKSPRLLLSYTSTPFRGLVVLIAAFPGLRREFPEAELEVFSSMKVYQQDEPGDPYAPLYRQCRVMPGVRFAGSVPQPGWRRGCWAFRSLRIRTSSPRRAASP